MYLFDVFQAQINSLDCLTGQNPKFKFFVVAFYYFNFSRQTWCLTSSETIRLIRDGEKGGKGVCRWGEEGDYIPIATLSPPELLLH